jgi:predicted transcriptional regulator
VQTCSREYVEIEYGRLEEIRKAERELEDGQGIPHEQVAACVQDLKGGKCRPDQRK